MMDHPLIYRRATIRSTRSHEGAQYAVDTLIRLGVDIEDRHHSIYGWRRGGVFSFSDGAPLFSHRPVLRGRFIPVGGGVEARVSVGARAESIVVFTGFVVFLAASAVYQIVLQLAGSEVPEGGRLAGLLSVLPGMGIMASIVAGSVWWMRRTAAGHAEFLLAILRWSLGAEGSGPESPALSAEPID